MTTASTTTEILVFKTNLRYKKDVLQVAPLMEQNDRIVEWNVDREDADHVLRIASNELEATEVIEMLARAGYYCQELPD